MARSWLPLGFLLRVGVDTIRNVKLHSTNKIKPNCTSTGTFPTGIRYPYRVKITVRHCFNVRNMFLDCLDKSVVGRDWSWVGETRRG